MSVYSNGTWNYDSGINGTYGDPYQCVEFAQRWAAIGLGETDKKWGVQAAYQMWSVGQNLPVPLYQHANGGGDRPQFGDLIVFAPSVNSQGQRDNLYPAGHVAVVLSVTATSVVVVEQNWYENSPYVPGQNGTGTLPITGSTMPNRLVQSSPASYYPIYGWMRAAPPVANGPSTRITGNFFGTGYDASAVLYDYGGGHAKMLGWYNTPGSGFSTQWEFWWDSANAGPDPVPNPFDVSKVKLVAGYFQGGTYADIAMLYDASDASCQSHATWYVLKPRTGSHWFDTYRWWDSTNQLSGSGKCGFAVTRSKPVVGDFNGDGVDDVAVLYDSSSQSCPNWVKWFVFLSTSSSFQIDTLQGDPWLGSPWYNSNPNGQLCGAFSWLQSKPLAGHFGTALSTVAVFYDYSATCSPYGPRSVVHVFSTNGVTFPDYSAKWDSGASCQRYPWDLSTPLAGNFTSHADNQTDVAVLFDSSNACAPIQPRTQLYLLIWNGTTLQDSPLAPWDSGCNLFALTRSKPEVGHFTGGAETDLGVLYNYDWRCTPYQRNGSPWLVFVPSGSGLNTSFPPPNPIQWDKDVYQYNCNGVTWNLSTPT